MSPGGTTTKQDALQLLKADHDKVLQLFENFDKKKASWNPEEKKSLVDQVCMELAIHAYIEEEIFYPAVKEAIEDDDLVNEAQVEHEEVKHLIAKIQELDPEEERFDAHVTVLAEYVRHHAREEEEEIFPQAREAGLDLKELGQELERLKEEVAESWDGSMLKEEEGKRGRKKMTGKKESPSASMSGGSTGSRKSGGSSNRM